jgi:glycosyltransferase involved in cell wall biosynthesis
MMSKVSPAAPQPELVGRRELMSLSVLAETAYPRTVASARVRVGNFVPLLRRHGVSLRYRSALTDADYRILSSPGRVGRKTAALGLATARTVLRERPEHDLLLVHRLRLLTPLPWFDPPPALDVYDIDDPLFLPFTGGVNRRFRWTKQEAWRCIQCLQRSRLVVAGNSYLAGNAKQYAHRVEVVPSCVDPSTQPVHQHHEQEVVTVGWIGSPSTSPYLQPILPVFDRLNSTAFRAKLVLVGADRRLAAPWIQHRDWTLTTERDDLASFDIGIIPQPDDEWARGKCGYKILQYFAAGVPAIGSPVGVTRELITGERGEIAGSAAQWYSALRSLIEDPAKRAEQGAAGLQFVKSDYSYQRWAPELATLLRSLSD